MRGFNFMEKFKAFTLAEVLVTLGIIGVVSAMTVPTLMQNYQRQSYVTQLHKVYNELGQAAERYKADNNLVSLREGRIMGNKDEVHNFVLQYFKVVKDCGGRYWSSASNACFAQKYTSIDGSSTTNTQGHECFATVVLASGAALCFDTGAATSVGATEDINGDGKVDENDVIANTGVNAGMAITVEVDVNGPKGPNVAGRDLFSIDIAPNGLVYDSKWTDSSTVDTAHAWPVGIGKIIADGWQMTY